MLCQIEFVGSEVGHRRAVEASLAWCSLAKVLVNSQHEVADQQTPPSAAKRLTGPVEGLAAHGMAAAGWARLRGAPHTLVRHVVLEQPGSEGNRY